MYIHFPQCLLNVLIIFFFFSPFCPFRDALKAHGGSQARGLIEAVAASLHHCEWIVYAPEPNQKIVLNFNPHFEIEKHDCK